MPNRKLVAVFVLVVVIFCGTYWYFYNTRDDQYLDMPNLAGEYNVDNEVKQAGQKLNEDIPPAKLYVNSTTKKEVALTFDGLPDPATTEKLLDLLDKYHAKATFFIEGSNAAVDSTSLQKIHERNYPIGNYTYVGLSELEKMPEDEILQQLLKTQEVIKHTTGSEATVFKAPHTIYTDTLLKTAAAAGLQAAVKTNVYVKKDAITTDEAADAFVSSIAPGSIVSLPLTTSVSQVPYTPENKDEKLASAKLLKLKTVAANSTSQNVVDVTERLLEALQKHNMGTMDITDMRRVKGLEMANEEDSSFPVAMLNSFPQKIIAAADTLLFTKAEAASADYEALRQKNAGAKADPTKMILTTEPAVSFVFAGLTSPDTVYDILGRLKKMNASGTFFVMKNDIDKNPGMIKDIIASGNEVGIGIRSLKGTDFYSVCAEIDYVRSRLEAMGASPTLAMQPWGAVDDDTREAVSAMGLTMITPYINVVRSDMKDCTSEEDAVNNLFGEHVYALGRGWIVYFRLDYYTDHTMAGKVLDLIKRKKIDNIAYNSFYDDPKINTANNDSAYSIKPAGEILANTAYRYSFSSKANVPERLRGEYNEMTAKKMSFNSYIKQRFIGNVAVGPDSNAYGFSLAEMRSFDQTGRIHTNDPVVFFTFDDWGTDASLNPLLYVLRKHNVKGNFFILTHNVMSNPNLLRTIAMEGHDIGAHSDWHKPMTTQNTRTNVQEKSTQSREEYMQDLHDCYTKLETIVGDVVINGHPALNRYFRPPQLTVSKMGFECLYANGYTYIIDGSYSTHDYDQPNIYSMLNDIKKGIYDENGRVRKGAVLVMHMSDNAEYTARALDLLLTANEQRPDGDPAKFTPARLSDYLKDGYDQSNPVHDETEAASSGTDSAGYLYTNSGYGMGGE